MDFRPTETTKEALAQYTDLLQACFPGTDKFSETYLTWLYRDNPDGKVVGYDAWEGDVLAAHYVTVPAMARVGCEDVKVLLSLNTATHPDHRGKGLFTQLAARTYDAGTEQGFDAVYGVANASSTPGFLRKLEFQHVAPLWAKVGVGGLGAKREDILDRARFYRKWSPESLAWRCASPCNPVVAARKGSGVVLRTRGAKGTTAWTEVPEPFDVSTSSRSLSPLRLFLGLLPSGVSGLRGFMDIPKRFRPSPLNLIYRSLSGRLPQIEQDAVFLTFADFDAY